MTHPRKISTNNMSSLNTNQSPQQLKPQRGKKYFKKEEIWVKVFTIPSFSSKAHGWWWLGDRADSEDCSRTGPIASVAIFWKTLILFTIPPFPAPCRRPHFRSQKPCNLTSGSVLNIPTSLLEIVNTWNMVSWSENICIYMKEREVEYNMWLPSPRSEGRSPIPGPSS